MTERRIEKILNMQIYVALGLFKKDMMRVSEQRNIVFPRVPLIAAAMEQQSDDDEGSDDVAFKDLRRRFSTGTDGVVLKHRRVSLRVMHTWSHCCDKKSWWSNSDGMTKSLPCHTELTRRKVCNRFCCSQRYAVTCHL